MTTTETTETTTFEPTAAGLVRHILATLRIESIHYGDVQALTAAVETTIRAQEGRRIVATLGALERIEDQAEELGRRAIAAEESVDLLLDDVADAQLAQLHAEFELHCERRHVEALAGELQDARQATVGADEALNLVLDHAAKLRSGLELMTRQRDLLRDELEALVSAVRVELNLEAPAAGDPPGLDVAWESLLALEMADDPIGRRLVAAELALDLVEGQ
ncbi:MAG TPA: hypothetical protein VGE07_23540 [Herpetosiphonaceae bacterium]